jgi:PhzF family phenazine biosynthesis protein
MFKGESMETLIFQIDAFTSEPFKGNPAAVCLLLEPKSDDWMQSVSTEMNLSETAFLFPEQDGYRLRWFTPKTEVDLCGHATLASAHAIWETGIADKNSLLKFYTRSGLLTAQQNNGWIELDFPVSKIEAVDEIATLSEALHVPVLRTVQTDFDLLAEIEGEEVIKDLNPDMTRLAALPTRGIIVTSRGNSKPYDFISRFFGPNVGVNEDPVTGSAHCALAPYWHDKLGKTSFFAFQSSYRGGELKIELRGSRVGIAGQAVTVLSGKLGS